MEEIPAPDLSRYAGEAAQSAEMLERALFALEAAWHPWLAGALAAGCAPAFGASPG
jgi:hypothetical protein